MKVAPLIAVALILCIAFPGPIQAKKKKFCVGKDGNRYKEGEGYDYNEGNACIHYKCVKKKQKFVMKKKGKCAPIDGEWSPWSSWSDCSATCGPTSRTRKRTCSSPEPSNAGKPCPGMDEEVEECSNPPCGSVENVNVTALELNVQSLNDSMQALQTTMQSILELITNMQSTTDKQGTCMSDLTSSDCPPSAVGKTGIVDGITANTADISTNMAGLASNKAGIATNKNEISLNKDDINSNNDTCSSIQATATQLETCLGDVNSVSCPSSKGGKTSVPDAIMKNKDAVESHHPDSPSYCDSEDPTYGRCNDSCPSGFVCCLGPSDPAPLPCCYNGTQCPGTVCSSPPTVEHGIWTCDEANTECCLMCRPGFASPRTTTTCIDGAFQDISKMKCFPSIFLMGWTYEKDLTIFDAKDEHLVCSLPPPSLGRVWDGNAFFTHQGVVYICGGENIPNLCLSISQSLYQAFRTHTLSASSTGGHSLVPMKNTLYLIGGLYSFGKTMMATLPLTDNNELTEVPDIPWQGGYQCVIKIDCSNFIVTGGYSSVIPYGFSTNVFKYNVDTKMSTVLKPMSIRRSEHACGLFEVDNKQWIVVSGGRGKTAERYDVAGNEWEQIGDLNEQMRDHKMLVTENHVMVIGPPCTGCTSQIERLDWTAKTWTTLTRTVNGIYIGGVLEIPKSIFRCDFLGCFDDTANPKLYTNVINLPGTNSYTNCKAECLDKHSTSNFFGTEEGSKCYCGVTPQPPTTAHPKADNFLCDEIGCPGDLSTKCGGFGYIKVWKINP